MSILIGICGEIGSGKTLVTDYLVKRHSFNEYAFAKPLKDIALAMGFNKSEVYGNQKQKMAKNKHLDISARVFLQKFGTEIGRDLIPTILPDMNLGNSGSLWVRLFEIYFDKLIENSKSNTTNLIISDVRFANEAESIKEKGGYIIRLIRPNLDISGDEHKHISELGVKDIKPNVIIINKGTKEELYKSIDNMVLQLTKKNK